MGTPINRDRYGVPYLTATEIEDLSKHFLEVMAPEVLTHPTFLPLASVMTRLSEEHGIKFALDESLGEDAEGNKYLGWYDVTKRVIVVDAELLLDDPRFPFTVAHEIGHWYLHTPIKLDALGLASEHVFKDTPQTVLMHRKDAPSIHGRIEWQANRFAAGVLVPRHTLKPAVISCQKGCGIVKNLGTIWIDGQRGNRRDHRWIVTQLSELYQTSRAVVTIRLRELGIAQYKNIGKPPSQLADLLGTAVDSMFGGGAEPDL